MNKKSQVKFDIDRKHKVTASSCGLVHAMRLEIHEGCKWSSSAYIRLCRMQQDNR